MAHEKLKSMALDQYLETHDWALLSARRSDFRNQSVIIDHRTDCHTPHALIIPRL